MKKIYLALTVAFFCLAFKGEDLHSIHISIAEVDYFTDKKEIQVALKVFTDDLEASIVDNKKLKLNLDSPKEVKNADGFIKEYLIANFKIDSNIENTNKGFKYLGKEYEDAATWMYFSYELDTNIKELKILNKVVLNIYDDQKNVINFRKDRELVKTTFTNKKSKSIKIDLE
jgi:hypothetical protein